MFGLNRPSGADLQKQVAEFRRKLTDNGCVLERVDLVGPGLLDRRFKDVGGLFNLEDHYALNTGIEKGRCLIEMWRKPGK